MKISRDYGAVFFSDEKGTTILGFHPNIHIIMLTYYTNENNIDVEIRDNKINEELILCKNKAALGSSVNISDLFGVIMFFAEMRQ